MIKNFKGRSKSKSKPQEVAEDSYSYLKTRILIVLFFVVLCCTYHNYYESGSTSLSSSADLMASMPLLVSSPQDIQTDIDQPVSPIRTQVSPPSESGIAPKTLDRLAQIETQSSKIKKVNEKEKVKEKEKKIANKNQKPQNGAKPAPSPAKKPKTNEPKPTYPPQRVFTPVSLKETAAIIEQERKISSLNTERIPVQGNPIGENGAKPLFGFHHKGGDAIFALATNYPIKYYQRFVGSLRKVGYDADIVLAVSPPEKMRAGVENYVKKHNVIAYAFEVDCNGKDSCRFKDDFLGYPDPRPFRTFANIRYALYESWLRYYSSTSYILILDFRDTFFQADPFLTFGPIDARKPRYDLQMYAENHAVKSIGKCVYNSFWVGRCFSRESLQDLKKEAVICSGSTLGSYDGISYYVSTMLRWMDKIQCWKKGIESDQGYQNYLFYNGYFNTPMGNATLYHQGNGVVNTIGAMNGKRVPKNMKGPLDTFWKIRDTEGYILNNDGSKSACVHQWDRFYSELYGFLDTKLY